MPPSPAQLRVREHALEVLQAYPPPYCGYGNFSPALTVLAQHLAADPTITMDTLLGWELSRSRHNTTYLSALTVAGSHDVRDHLVQEIQDFQPYGVSRGKIYQGDLDKNPQVTMWVLLGLAAGEQVSGHEFSAWVCPEAGLIWSKSNGVHRLLAHILWGSSTLDLPGATFTILHEPFDPLVDQTCQTLERDLPHWAQRHPWNPLSPEVRELHLWQQEDVWAALTQVDAHHAWPGTCASLSALLGFCEDAHHVLSGRRRRNRDTVRDLQASKVVARYWWWP